MALPADDFANTISDPAHPFGEVPLNGTAIGTLELTGDRDWFAIQSTAGASYLINLQGQTAGGGSLADPYLRLHDATGALLAENDDIDSGVNRNAQLTFTAATSSTYYLEAGAFNDALTGTYTVGFSGIGVTDDFPNNLADSASASGRVLVNNRAFGTLEVSGDRDWFGVQLIAGTTYVINFEGQHNGAGTLEDPFLRLHDANGALLAQNDDIQTPANRDSQLTFMAAATGIYYLEAGAFNDDYVGTYRVSVTATALTDDLRDSLTDTTAPLGLLVVNGSASGSVEAVADRDWFQVQLTAGAIYTIALQGLMAGVGTLDDPYLRLRDGNGTLLAENDDIQQAVNRDSQVTVTAPATGAYYVEAGAFADNSFGTYTVRVTTSGAPGPAPPPTPAPGPSASPPAGAAPMPSPGPGLDVNAAPYGDFDGNGRSDLLWRHENGQIATWQTNNAGVLTSSVALGSASSDWHIDGTGDFNHDGRSDILFRNEDQRLAVWQTDGQKILSISVLGSASSAWHSAGIGDFNGDGTSDLLFRNDSGQIAQWLISNNQIQTVQILGSTSPSFHLVGISDFNGDGKADLLFRDQAGVLATWILNGNQLQSAQVIGTSSIDWHLVGTGDFNGDGSSDLLWRNDNGQVALWLMNGSALQSIQIVGTAGLQFHVEGTGDFNGDGRSDILLRDTAGAAIDWLMNGASIQTAQVLGSASNEFHLAAFHFDLV